MPTIVDISAFLADQFEVFDIQELALGANMDVSELDNRLKFMPSSSKKHLNKIDKLVRNENDLITSYQVTFNPMQIRTFRVFYNGVFDSN